MARMYKSTRRRSREEEREDETADRKTVYEWEEDVVVKDGSGRAMATTRRTLAGWLQAHRHAHTYRQAGRQVRYWLLVEDDIRKRSRKAPWANRV